MQQRKRRKNSHILSPLCALFCKLPHKAAIYSKSGVSNTRVQDGKSVMCEVHMNVFRNSVRVKATCRSCLCVVGRGTMSGVIAPDFSNRFRHHHQLVSARLVFVLVSSYSFLCCSFLDRLWLFLFGWTKTFGKRDRHRGAALDTITCQFWHDKNAHYQCLHVFVCCDNFQLVLSALLLPSYRQLTERQFLFLFELVAVTGVVVAIVMSQWVRLILVKTTRVYLTRP